MNGCQIVVEGGYKQETSYLAMSLMSQYESSFTFQKMHLAPTDIDKRMISMQVEIMSWNVLAGAQARFHEGVISMTFSFTSSGMKESNE